ncbi:MAG: DUF58 domain-containing protein [Porphyromonas sp.]|uniref:DUF58 domain-containing protein n=1 Tax=Porphyromonas sp. TaxID=1924944 RepID=UPI002A91BA21|nr:DUF58 domain-containing protein [Porphyromonas sp.]MDD7468436.1 DUF58 domain-containing protein [Bacteroidales bacterium]MDY6101806.1 DUF58 domain-containing protein [Porphyromonas sp.]
MDTQELLKRLRRIEIKSSRLSEDIFSGAYRSAFKGRGMSFSEVREYQPGDDVRDIDWNVTARYARPYVKVYEEERELTMILLVDISRSEHFGTVGMTKRQRVAEIAGTLAFSTIKNNDNVGVIFYSDRVEKYIPPSKGHKHVLTILSEILSIEPEGSGTDISVALRFAHNVQRKSCTLFLLSDFIDGSDYAKTLAVVRNKHDLLAMQVYDPHEAELPMVGLLRVRDAETGEVRVIDSSSKSVRKQYREYWQELSGKLRETFSKYNIGYASVSTSEDYVPRLQRLFTHPRI